MCPFFFFNLLSRKQMGDSLDKIDKEQQVQTPSAPLSPHALLSTVRVSYPMGSPGQHEDPPSASTAASPLGAGQACGPKTHCDSDFCPDSQKLETAGAIPDVPHGCPWPSLGPPVNH